MGKQKVLSETDLHEMVLPSANDVLNVVQKMLGFYPEMNKFPGRKRAHLQDQGQDEVSSLGKGGRYILMSPWDFQSEERGEIFWRYTQNQVDPLKQRGILKIE